MRTDSPLGPWLLSAAVLVALASWDPLARGGGFDITLLGLAAYELLIALTRPVPAGRAVEHWPVRASAQWGEPSARRRGGH